jgi:cytochrome c-type biogenesis protein CcmH/NrfG
MRTRGTVVVLVAALLFYLVVVAERGIVLVGTGRPALVAFGVGVLLLPLVGVWFIVTEVRFGRAMARLGRRLEAEGGLPTEAPADLAEADAVFAQRRAAVQAGPDDWRMWYLLALAYGDARDTPRGRRAMRRAIILEREESSSATD